MAETRTLAEKLDDNLFSDKNFKKIYLYLSYWLILTPLVETLFYSFGAEFSMLIQVLTIATLFALTKTLEITFNFKKINLKNKKLVDWLIVALFLWFILTSILYKSINPYFFIACSYFITFIMIINLKKENYVNLAKVFAIEMVIDTILGLIDLNNAFIPGFSRWSFSMSLQFSNPNWSGFVMIIAGMVILWFIEKSEKIWQKSLWFAGFTILCLGLFVGGSYSPEFTLYLGELAFLIYLWIKKKKCPFWVLSAMLTSIFMSFFVWFFPVFIRATTASANFFYESLAVIDGKLETNLCRDVSTFFCKIFGVNPISSVAGSDGWQRDDLIYLAFKEIFSSPKSFIFGKGCGYCYSNVRVHNCYVTLWFDIGLPELLLYLGIIVCFIVRFIKIQKTDKIIFLFLTFAIMLFEKLFCCIEIWCYIYFVILCAVLYKELYSAPLKQKKQSEKLADLQESKIINQEESF